jgi:hypothetical protein
VNRAQDVPPSSWLLLLHQLPAKPDYLRVKIWRRMQQIGAIPLKNAAWVLPEGESSREDFEWVMREIQAAGGEAVLCDARFVAGLSESQRQSLQALMAPRPRGATSDRANAQSIDAQQGRVWVTRKNVFVDRMASAWLIRRYVDPQAQFKFVSDSYEPVALEVGFDMFGGQFTHVGDACTFEVLASSFVPGDATVAKIAQIVHDIDLKDEKYGHPMAPGIEAALSGLCATIEDDVARLHRSADLLDWVHASLRL